MGGPIGEQFFIHRPIACRFVSKSAAAMARAQIQTFNARVNQRVGGVVR